MQTDELVILALTVRIIEKRDMMVRLYVIRRRPNQLCHCWLHCQAALMRSTISSEMTHFIIL